MTSLLAKYLNPDGEDPVVQTITFLRKKQFAIEIRSLKIRIPDNLSDNTLRPGSEFKLLHQARGQDSIDELVLKLEGSGSRDGSSATIYEYRPQGANPLTFTLAPGDGFSPRLTLQEGTKTWQLRWTRCRSTVFQMERLSQEPRLYDPEKPGSKGQLVRGVTIKIDRSIETVPELIPAVVYESK